MFACPQTTRRPFGAYLACAAAIHAAIFAMSGLHSGRAATASATTEGAVHALNLDVLPPNSDLPATPPSPGPPTPRARTVASDAPRAPRAIQAAPKTVSIVEPRRGGPSSSVRDAFRDRTVQADEDDPSDRFALQASDTRRRRDMARAAAAASNGAGYADGSGTGGSAIRGNIAFGNGSHGALTGRVCFLPVGTLRIADARDCQYAATVYTDTLDIPERQFSDGFPGITNRSEWFLIDYTGTFSVTGYGTYVFRLHSDDGSYLYIDDELVIDNDGKHAPESRSGEVLLAVGEHRIKVRYAQTNDRMALQLFVRTPGRAVETIFTTHL
jgi:hypothetical protein